MTRNLSNPKTPTDPALPIKIEIEAGGRRVAIEAPGTLTVIKNVALELWRASDGPVAHGTGTSVGFTMSDAQHQSLLPPELTLPHRIEGDPPDVRLHR